MSGLMAADINELNNFLTEIENLTSNPAVLAKCSEAKMYIQVLSGVVEKAEA